MRIDLNCDLGEGMEHDEELMALITSANIACGGHAGDIDTMRRSVALAQRHGVAIGAHPGFADKPNFGRREVALGEREIEELVRSQTALLCGMADVVHVKPHGALYNMAARDERIAAAVARGIIAVDGRLVFIGLAQSAMLAAGKAAGLKVASEVFADRTYQADGSLTPRARKDGLIENEDASVNQVLGMVIRGTVKAVDGAEVKVLAETVCLHGNGPLAVSFARRLRQSLKAAEIDIKPLAARAAANDDLRSTAKH